VKVLINHKNNSIIRGYVFIRWSVTADDVEDSAVSDTAAFGGKNNLCS